MLCHIAVVKIREAYYTMVKGKLLILCLKLKYERFYINRVLNYFFMYTTVSLCNYVNDVLLFISKSNKSTNCNNTQILHCLHFTFNEIWNLK